MLVARSAKDERIQVRVPEELKRALQEDAEKSGWGLSDQIRFELLVRRGMWRGPYLPDPEPEEKAQDYFRGMVRA
jgi:hypothetical protein